VKGYMHKLANKLQYCKLQSFNCITVTANYRPVSYVTANNRPVIYRALIYRVASFTEQAP
jgi:hypothetical protein